MYGSVSVIDLRKQRENSEKNQIWQKSHWILWDFARSGENLTKFDDILLDLVKILSELREISPEYGFFSQDLENYLRNLGFLLESEFLSIGSSFSSFGGGKLKLTCWSWFMVVKTHRRSSDGRVGQHWIKSDRFLQVDRVFGWVWTTLFIIIF